MTRNPKKTKSMVVCRSRIITPGYGDLTLGGAEFEVYSLRMLLITLDSKWTFATRLREFLLKAARSCT